MFNTDHYIEKMKNSFFFFGVNLSLAVGIFFCALIGRSLGIQGPALAISVVWPATGLSLAGLLLFGYSAGLGVFIGNLAYNILFLSQYPLVLDLPPLHRDMVAIFISIGSLAQSLVSTYIIRTYSSSLIFRTVKDIFIFLIPASLLSCLISSTIGVATLVMAGGLDKSLILPAWLTFWLGDTVGIYVITPLIIIWTLQSLEPKISDHIPSIVCMILLFLIFSFVTYFVDYPLPHLFVPISIWAAYLFRMHGASSAIFLMTAASITFAAFHGYEGTSLISLITFIGVTVAASLVIASVVNERAEAWALLNSRNVYLQNEVDVKVEILEHVRSEIFQKRKKTTNSLSKVALQIQAFLGNIDLATKSAKDVLEEIQKILTAEKSLTPEEKEFFSRKLNEVKEGLTSTLNSRILILEAIERLKA